MYGFNIEYAELQFVGDSKVGDHSAKEIQEIDNLLEIGANHLIACYATFLQE